MNKNRQRIVAICLTVIITAVLIYPHAAEARNPFKNIFRAIRRTANFVVNLPNKATRWMGPVLGPIASSILTQNLSSHAEIGQIFRRAQQAQRIFDSIDEQKRVLGQIKDIYRNQANELDTAVQKMQEVRDQFAQRMLSDPDYGFAGYKNDVIALDRVIESYRQAAVDMRNTADRLDTGGLIKMLGRDAIKDFLRGSEAIAIGEVKGQLDRFINPDIIKTFVERGEGGDVLDVILSGDIKRLLGNTDTSGIDMDALLERIKNRIKDLAESERDGLKNNWKNKINELINEEVKNIKNNLPAAPAGEGEGEGSEEPASEPEDLGPIPTDEHGCAPGYVFRPQSGVGCVQEDCNTVESGHYSYEGYCICGSSGSIAENPADPNKECNYPPTYRSCPGCLYACVHLDEECPELPE